MGGATAPILRRGFRVSKNHPAFTALAASCAIIVALWLIAVWRWIATDSVVPWDSKNQSYAFFRFIATSLHSGAMPFWNPYHYGGHPSVADPQSLIFAPAFFIWAWFDPDPSIRAFDILVYAHLLAGALAIAVIGWRAEWPVAACVLAACIFMFGGAASGRLQHTGMILSYGLFPVALLFLQLALSRRSIVFGLMFAVVAAALALGRNQVAMLLCFVLIAVAIAEIVTRDKPRQVLERAAARIRRHAARGLRADRDPDAADHPIRGVVEPAGCRARFRFAGFAASRQSRDALFRQRVRLA